MNPVRFTQHESELTPALALWTFWVSSPPDLRPASSFVFWWLAPLRPSVEKDQNQSHANICLRQKLTSDQQSCTECYLDVVWVFSSVFSLGFRRGSELQRARVDVKAAQFSGQRRWNQLIILQRNKRDMSETHRRDTRHRRMNRVCLLTASELSMNGSVSS